MTLGECPDCGLTPSDRSIDYLGRDGRTRCLPCHLQTDEPLHGFLVATPATLIDQANSVGNVGDVGNHGEPWNRR